MSLPTTTRIDFAANHPRRDPWWVRCLLVLITLGFVALLLVLPLIVIFVEAFRQGAEMYLRSFRDPIAWHSIRLTLLATGIAVPLNTIFGVAAAWAIAKFQFRGKSLLTSLVDLPFAVSPVVSGLVFVLLFGLNGWFGKWLTEHGIRIIFAIPGIILATIFVTVPFVARELIPLMEEQGNEEEQAAISLGASGWQTFWKITIPSIRWGLLYGVILCAARAIGEFGAVSVVSGHIRGRTNTVPLHIEILYNEYNMVAAFAMATSLAMLAVITLILKAVLEFRIGRQRSAAARLAEIAG